ncbi:hypothetical protein HUJ05_000470 [Dendroctonus ponderosae]|nr:hypothetical protein HUJ05_000470 [Dendroctonus ponderosae]
MVGSAVLIAHLTSQGQPITEPIFGPFCNAEASTRGMWRNLGLENSGIFPIHINHRSTQNTFTMRRQHVDLHNAQAKWKLPFQPPRVDPVIPGSHKFEELANLYVKNLDGTIDDERLRAEFAPFGTITQARVMMEGGRSRGFGFVYYTTEESAQLAVAEMDGSVLGSSPISVSLCRHTHDGSSIKPETTRDETNGNSD